MDNPAKKRPFVVIATIVEGDEETLAAKKRQLLRQLDWLGEPPTLLTSPEGMATVSAFAVALEIDVQELLSKLMRALGMLGGSSTKRLGAGPKDEIVVIEMGAEHAALDNSMYAAIGILKEKAR
jgi:hypothetical protein